MLSLIWSKTLSGNSRQLMVIHNNGFWDINFKQVMDYHKSKIVKLETAATPFPPNVSLNQPHPLLSLLAKRGNKKLGKPCYRILSSPLFSQQQQCTKQIGRLHKGYSETSCNKAKSSKLLSKYLPQSAECPWLLLEVISRKPWHVRTCGGHPLF